jgi:hypothetical protein
MVSHAQLIVNEMKNNVKDETSSSTYWHYTFFKAAINFSTSSSVL